MNKTKIVITEPSGFIGRELVKQLKENEQSKKTLKNRFKEILGSKIG
jgi:nucleoside-diphosphate-sugar epimerase